MHLANSLYGTQYVTDQVPQHSVLRSIVESTHLADPTVEPIAVMVGVKRLGNSHSIDWRDGGDAGIKDYGPEKPAKKLFANYFDPAPVKFDDYIANKALPQVQELVDNYKLC